MSFLRRAARKKTYNHPFSVFPAGETEKMLSHRAATKQVMEAQYAQRRYQNHFGRSGKGNEKEFHGIFHVGHHQPGFAGCARRTQTGP